MKAVTFKQLRALAATARTGSVSDAAKWLNVTPPAVTLQLQQLEASARVPLLERTSQGFRPTAAGKHLLAAAEHIEAILQECGTTLESMRGLRKGHVTLGAVSTAKYFAPGAIAAFARRYPHVEHRLVVGNRNETIAALERYEVDFAIMGRPPEHFEIESVPIARHPHVIIAAPSHALASESRVRTSRLGKERILAREKGSGTRALLERTLEAAGHEPDFSMEMDSNETIKQAVMAGLGIALISAHTIAAEIADGRLIMLDVEGFPIERHWHIVRRKDRRPPPAVQAFWSFLEREANGLLPHVAALDQPRPADATVGKRKRAV